MKNAFILCAAGLICAYGFYRVLLHQTYDLAPTITIGARSGEQKNRSGQPEWLASSEGVGARNSSDHSAFSTTDFNDRHMTTSEARRLGELLARKDPASGLREITKRKNEMGEMHFFVQQELLARWFLLSPASFLHSSEVIQECLGEKSYNSGWMEKAIEYDFYSFRDNLQYIADGQDKKVALDQVSSILMQRDPPSAVLWARSLPLDNQAFVLKQIVMKGGALAPEQAASLAKTMPADSERVELVQTIAAEWVGKDVTAALEWCETLSTRSEREAAFGPIFAVYVEKEPEKAAECALRLVDSASGAPYLRRAIQELAKTDMDRAWDYTQDLAKLGRGDEFMKVMVEVWADLDPVEALDVISRESAMPDTILPNLVERIAVLNPFVLADRISQLPEGKLRTSALNSSARELWRKNPAKAREWLDSDAARPHRDDAISAITMAFSDFAPEEMRELSAQINDPVKRALAAQHVARVLQNVTLDPGASIVRK